MNKGFVNILELVVVGIILTVAFAHFFPQYKITTDWDSRLLELEVRDTLVTIDRLNKTYDFADANLGEFDTFMSNIFEKGQGGDVFVWWRKVDGLPNATSDPTPYYTRGTEKSIVDVVNTTSGFRNYTFTIGLGNPY
jgi:hypothetical protein